MPEQRNPYKGTPLRPWVKLRFVSPNGQTQDVECVADTGNPFAIIVSPETMQQFRYHDGPSAQTNFGLMTGGLLRVSVPDLHLDITIHGYASQSVVDAVQSSCPDFAGLVGLPLLRSIEYGGDSGHFWIRSTA